MAVLRGLGDWLRARLEADGLSQAEFARRAHLSEGFVSQLVRGVAKGREVDTQKRIAQGLGISHAELVASVNQQRYDGQQSETERAINHDPDLTIGQRRLLLDMYYELRGRRV